MRRFPFNTPTREFVCREGGQSVVLVALMFAVLMGFTAMSIDIGRFYAERRFVQNAVDTAALACAVKYATSGQDALQAWHAADDILQNRNLAHNPLGITLTYPAYGAALVYSGASVPLNLVGGILPTNNDGLGCRVAITVDVPTYLIKIVSSTLNTISLTTKAYAKAKGGLLPSVVKRYLNMGDKDDIAGNDGNNEFMDTTAALGYDSVCHAYSNYLPSCIPASFTQPGEEIVLFGASQRADNDSSFRGYIGLDVRDFSSNPLVHVSYNGVAPDATTNTLKDFEANWITQGYPGPDICTVQTTQFLACAQIAAINGSASGIFVTYYNQWFRPGDIGLFQLYDGTTKTVPDFSFTPPTLQVPSTGAIPSYLVSYSMSAQFASSASQICTDLVYDNGTLTHGPGDTTGNPFVQGKITVNNTNAACTGTGVGNLSVNPTPTGVSSYGQTLSGLSSSLSAQGIYQVFVRGTASAPYSARVHYLPAKVVVAGQNTEYDVSSSVTSAQVTMSALPASVSWTQVVGVGSGNGKWHPTGISPDGPITVTWESCPRSADGLTVLTCYIGSPGVTSTAVTAGTNVDVTAVTSGVATQNSYYGWIRFIGYDATNHPVVKLNQVRLDVDQATGGTTSYVDVLGFAAYQITRMDSNDVYGKAVSAAYLNPNDSNLSVGKKITLVPWETP